MRTSPVLSLLIKRLVTWFRIVTVELVRSMLVECFRHIALTEVARTWLGVGRVGA